MPSCVRAFECFFNCSRQTHAYPLLGDRGETRARWVNRDIVIAYMHVHMYVCMYVCMYSLVHSLLKEISISIVLDR